MRVVKSEKMSWMALWQLQHVPRRITQALDATQTARKTTEKLLEWRNTTWTHTHTHISVDVLYPGVCFTCFLSSLLFSNSTVLFFHSHTFPTSLFSLSIFITFSQLLRGLSKQQWENQPKTGSLCSILRLLVEALCILVHGHTLTPSFVLFFFSSHTYKHHNLDPEVTVVVLAKC